MRLPSKLQTINIEKRFRQLNPEAVEYGAHDEIDFSSIVGKKETYKENIEAFEKEYPQYKWREGPKIDDPYEKYAIKDIKSQASEYGYDVVKLMRLRQLEKKEKELDTMIKSLREKESQLSQVFRNPKIVIQPKPKPPIIRLFKKTEPINLSFIRPRITTKQPSQITIKKTHKKSKPQKPKIYKGKRGGKYYLKQRSDSRKKRRVYI